MNVVVTEVWEARPCGNEILPEFWSGGLGWITA